VSVHIDISGDLVSFVAESTLLPLGSKMNHMCREDVCQGKEGTTQDQYPTHLDKHPLQLHGEEGMD